MRDLVLVAQAIAQGVAAYLVALVVWDMLRDKANHVRQRRGGHR